MSDDVTVSRRKLLNGELHDLASSPNLTSLMLESELFIAEIIRVQSVTDHRLLSC
jgi:hypothetical protein